MKVELGGQTTELRRAIEGWGERIEVIKRNVGVLSSDIAALKTQLGELGGGAAIAPWMPNATSSILFHMDAYVLKPPALVLSADGIPGLSPNPGLRYRLRLTPCQPCFGDRNGGEGSPERL